MSRISIAATLLSFLLLPCTNRAQQFPPFPSPDTSAAAIERRWPNIRLVRMDPQLADAVIVAGLSRDVAELERKSMEAVIEDPMNQTPGAILAAIRAEGGATFEGFKANLCARYREFDCEYDFDREALRQAFETGTRIANTLRRPPGPLYLLLSGPGESPTIHAALGFDSAEGHFRILSSVYTPDEEESYNLFRHFDSIAHSYLPFPKRFSGDVPYLLVDSVERWASVNGALGRETHPLPQTSPRSPALDSLIEQFEGRWPELKLVELDREILEPLWGSELQTDIEQLQSIGEIVAPAPLPDFDQVALRAVESQVGQRFESFKMLICRYCNVYDCDYDLDPDALLQAYTIARFIHSVMKELPGRFYLLLSRHNGIPIIHGIIGFDPHSPELRLLHYPSLPDPTSREMLKRRYDSIAAPVVSAYQGSHTARFSPLPPDSLESWSHRTEQKGKGAVPTQLGGFSFLWARTAGEMKKEFGPVALAAKSIKMSTLWNDPGVDTLGAQCDECPSLGLAPPRIRHTTRLTWTVALEVNDPTLFEKTLRTNAPLELYMRLFAGDINVFAGSVKITIIPDEPVAGSR